VIYTLREIAGSSYYRTRPVASLQFLYSKWKFAKSRLEDPAEMLETLGLDPIAALDGFERWAHILEEVVFEAGRRSGQGGINMPEGRFLFGITRALRPEIVIETGVAAGVSSCFFIAALLENKEGVLYSVDLPTEGTRQLECADASRYSWPEDGVGWAIPRQMRTEIGERHRLLLEDVRIALPRLLRTLPMIGVFFHDDLHLPDHMLWEYQSVWEHLEPRGVLASHDVNMGWIRFCREHGIPRKRLANLNRLCAARKNEGGA
jgi:hypothetical protein